MTIQMSLVINGIESVKINVAICHISFMIFKSFIIVCPPIRGDNPRALARGLSHVQVDNHGRTILYHLYLYRPCILRNSSCQCW